MKRHSITSIAAIVLSAVVLTACSEAPSSDVSATTQETEATTEQTTRAVISSPIAYTSNDTAEYDIDSDGTTDTISFTPGDEEEYTPGTLWKISTFMININNFKR